MVGMNNILGTAIRVEYDTEKDHLFLVFEITDEKFKQEVKRDWTQDIEVKIIGRKLIKE